MAAYSENLLDLIDFLKEKDILLYKDWHFTQLWICPKEKKTCIKFIISPRKITYMPLEIFW